MKTNSAGDAIFSFSASRYLRSTWYKYVGGYIVVSLIILLFIAIKNSSALTMAVVPVTIFYAVVIILLLLNRLRTYSESEVILKHNKDVSLTLVTNKGLDNVFNYMKHTKVYNVTDITKTIYVHNGIRVMGNVMREDIKVFNRNSDYRTRNMKKAVIPPWFEDWDIITKHLLQSK